ncbi:MAG: aldehyde dehydrogenase family protein [Candidatus Obscuribacterales bacterium]|nr:aldehyde dehydrogenase family protein [Cyanobacteria bacterium HKST-UBA01]MCB9471214.1 aldehyde dehydrogenase family protein [Candidatus Obscuribacterales bacterium]
MTKTLEKTKTCLNLIGGEWVKSNTGKTFTSYSPANQEEVIGSFADSDETDVKKAVDAAAKAFETWRKVPAPERAEIILRAGLLLEQHKESLAKDMTREMGKVLNEARGDVQEAIDMAKYAAGEGRRMFGMTVPAEMRNKFAMAVRAPLGVVGIITPWNFPVAIPSWKILPALVAGNTVVFKPATDTPYCAYRFVEILQEAGLPPGVINFVTGSGSRVGNPIIEDPRVRLISITGSSFTGRKVAGRCGELMKKISCELGGKNAICVMDDAKLELAVDGALWGAFGTTGQRCTATSRVILHKDIYEKFVDMFVKRAKELKVGDGLDPSVDVGPVINKDQLKSINEYVKIGQDEGAKLLFGGKILDKGDHAKGCFHEPTIFGDVKPNMRIAQEEIFGPVVALIKVNSFEEAIEVANGTEFGLSLSMYTQDVNRAFNAITDLESGIVYVNAPTIGAEIQLPFGGVKQTGNGHREAGTTAIDQFTEWKSIYVDYSGVLQRAQIDNHGDKK